MKILFSMRHPGALRNYSSTVEELAKRGHQIHLTFMKRDKLADPRLLDVLTGTYPDITHNSAEVSQRAWLGMARAIRSTADFLRYRTPEYRDAAALYERAAMRVSPAVQAFSRLPVVRSRSGLRFVTRLLRSIERAIPPDPAIVRQIARHSPDLVLVTPLIELGSDQVEYIKAAQALGIPSGLCVHSWDNLTNKGLIHAIPDRVFVWNEAQRKEAVDLHAIPDANIVVTGAPTYDQWFVRRPSTTREEFCRKVGLPAERPFFLYLCSSKFIAPREADYVKRWIQALRSAADPRVRDAAVLVRPHPTGDNQGLDGPELRRPNDVAVWPAGGANPVDTDSRNDYFDSLYHSVAAIGINTSAQIEAGIVGRPVYSIRAAEYITTQEGTLHFHYLLPENGGFLRVAHSLDEHEVQLAEVLQNPALVREQTERFVASFIRPHGLDVACTPLLAGAIERAGRETAAAPQREALTTRMFRAFVFPTAMLVHSFSEGGAFHMAARSSKKSKKTGKVKKDKKEKKEKHEKHEKKEKKAKSPKTVDATQ